MHPLTALFLFALAGSVGLKLWLAGRQIRHVKAHREQVPAAFADRVSLAEHRKAADYTAARNRFARWVLVGDALILLAWTLGGGLDALDGWLAGGGWDPLLLGVVFLAVVTLVGGLLDLPASAYRIFVIEAEFGFNRTSVRTFVGDLLKGALLMAVLGLPLAAIVLWLLGSAGPLWWLYTWLVWIGFNLLLLWAYPSLIAPLFNRFTPLQDAALRERVEGLLRRTGFASRGVYVADGSRRSAHGNAYFTGFGRNKRIVFFDTLLERLDAAEVEAVLAHELGHYKRRHVLKNLLLTAVVSLLALALLGWLKQSPWFYTALGLGRASDHAALALFMMVGPVFGFVLQPLLARWSRHHEFEADAFAAAQCPAADLVSALVRLYRDNASSLTPDPLHSAYYDSHPPAAARVAHLQRLGAAADPARDAAAFG